MIKFTADINGKPVLGIGISEVNVRKLKEGMPIKINDKDFFDGIIVIMYGKTEEHMAAELQKAGLISKDTIIKV